MRLLLAAVVLAVGLIPWSAPSFAESATEESPSKIQEAKQAVKEGAHTVGTVTRDTTRAIGHGARDATKAIGHGVRGAAHGVGDAAGKAWREATQ
jgi:hypothetical protein